MLSRPSIAARTPAFGVPRLSRRFDRRRARQSGRGSRRLKAAYEADKNTLRLADAYGRFLSRHNDIEGAKKVYEDFLRLIPNHPLIKAALADLDAGKPLAPAVHNAREGAAEALYGLGGAGTQQGDELAALIYLRLALIPASRSRSGGGHRRQSVRGHQAGRSLDPRLSAVPAASPMHESAELQVRARARCLGPHGRGLDASAGAGRRPSANPEAGARSAACSDRPKISKRPPILRQGGGADRRRPTRAIGRCLFPRHLLRALEAMAEGRGGFQEGAELFPEQPLVLNYLGYSWVDKGRNLDDAFKMLRRAVDLRPTDGYIVDSLGWADYKLGHYPERSGIGEGDRLKPADPWSTTTSATRTGGSIARSRRISSGTMRATWVRSRRISPIS